MLLYFPISKNSSNLLFLSKFILQLLKVIKQLKNELHKFKLSSKVKELELLDMDIYRIYLFRGMKNHKLTS